MCGERQRISIIGLLVALVIASFGCGGGSRANPAAGGDFTTALMPDIDSTSNEDGENAPADPAQNTEPAQQIADNGNQEEGGGNVPTSTIVSTPGDGGNTPPSLQQNTPPNPTPIPQTARQFDYSIIPEGHIALPPGHGLDPGEIRVINSLSEHHGDIIITCPPSGSFSWCDINIGEDGLATYDKNRLIPILQPEQITLPRSVDAAQAPVLDFVNVLHVGADVAPRADELTEGVDRNGVRASYGQIQDGIGADRVLEFLGQHTRLEDKLANSGIGTAPGLETYPEPPTIHLAEGTSDLYARFAAHAVQLINNALPYEKRITLNSEPLPADSGHSDIPEGEIFLEFTTQLNGRQLGGASLSSSYVTDSQTQQQEVQSAINARAGIFEKAMRSAFVHSPTEEDPYYWTTALLDSRVENTDKIIKMYNDRIFLSVIVHELIHTLGFFHIDESRFSDSIMHSEINDRGSSVKEYSPYLRGANLFFTFPVTSEASTNQIPVVSKASTNPTESEQSEDGYVFTNKARTVPGHILFPIDRAALLAAYGRFSPGAQPEELTAENLGSWTDTSFHLRGDMDFPGGEASFGVASSNGFAQPWAAGPTPWTNLEDNEFLSGSATWSGALLGVGSSLETVAGDAGLTVGLTSLTGQLDFTGLEKWGASEAPGAAGSGATWGDGDLGYTIEVRGNTFIQTGGDDGKVTGAFFGAAHEAMGGVLERADLAAGFGGKR